MRNYIYKHFLMSGNIKSIVVIVVAITLMAATLACCAEASDTGMHAEITKVPCDRLGAFTPIDLAAKDQMMKLSVVKAGDITGKLPVLDFKNSRMTGSAPSLATMSSLTDFSSISLSVWSENDTAVSVFFQDSDKCSFHALIPMKAGVWQKISLEPKDFQVNDDAPIKKQAVEPLKLRLGMLITDLGAMMGKSGPNSIRIASLEIRSKPLDVVNLPQVLDGQTLEISKNSIINGNTFIKNNGAIRINTDHVVLNGNIMIEKGTLEFNNTVLTMKSRFAHERAIGAGAGATVRFNKCTVIADQAIGLQVTNGARLEVEQSDCAAAGWTVRVDKGSTVNINKMKQFGEFIVNAGAQFSVNNSESFLIWLTPSGDKQIDLSLPADPTIIQWQLPEQDGFGINIRNSSGVKWGLISTPGTKTKVLNSQLLAVGILFSGNTQQTIVNIKSKQPATNLRIPASDRVLEFEGCTVGAWNFYAYGSSNITLKNCTVGEAFTVETSKMLLDSCVVDGTGGYVKGSGHSVMQMIKSKTTCNVVADGDAELSITDSNITGSLSAAGNAKVSMKRSTVTGLVTKLDKSTIVVIDSIKKKPVKH